MSKKKNLANHVSSAAKALLSNLPVFLTIALILGGIDTLLFHGALSINGLEASSKELLSNQMVLIQTSFTLLGLMMFTKAILGPFVSILVVVYSRASAMNSSLSLGKAVNFALKRYSVVFVPYLLALLSIQIGMIIIIPGVMFMMQYAFVDSVASLENEPHVLSRSKKLTKPRRKSLVLLILPYVILGQCVQFAEFIYSANPWKLLAINATFEGSLLLLLSSFYMMYHERVTRISEKRARRQSEVAETADKNKDANEPENNSSQ